MTITTIAPPARAEQETGAEGPLVDAFRAVLAELIPLFTQPDPELRLYTTAEAAELLGVSENWVTEKVKARSIPFTRVGRFTRFSAKNLRDLQAAGEVDPATRGRRRRAA
ncbi:helix-turn-helix domain-containing protein [Streptomyces sp. CC208A]|uniref:helix-turn-helix domain-containing protein n=1 Tax=Streptomyces sp. CC208A TaxID=3044573 RepID=UPI0024A7D30C|nr:helix-turn-helix domain-containing protein [Streptomyces sp. CC208A]